ncbi:MAG: M14 family metallocarboxypeptidase [Chloroflexi bacterium]|nr:M14 family metallocarboxypeptidase [Chloroflexota bacterium]
MAIAIKDNLELEIVRSYTQVIERLRSAASSTHVSLETLGEFTVERTSYPMFLARLGKPSPGKLSVLISAGIHGDEPAGVEAALRFIEHNIENPSLLTHYNFVIFPCDNPYGWERNVRENSQGVDLNRQFRVRQPAPEVELITRGLNGLCFDLVYEMHEDYDSPGFYLYEFGEDHTAYLGEPIIHEVATFGYPINRSHIIERRRARGGIIRLNLQTYRKTRLPKSFYAYRECGGQVLTLETPSTYLSLNDRVRIHLMGLSVSLNRAWLHKDAMSGI